MQSHRPIINLLMTSSSFNGSPERSRKPEKVNVRSCYSGGFKYPEHNRKPFKEEAVNQPEDLMSEQEILKLMGVTKPDQNLELLPNRDTLPGSKT